MSDRHAKKSVFMPKVLLHLFNMSEATCRAAQSRSDDLGAWLRYMDCVKRLAGGDKSVLTKPLLSSPGFVREEKNISEFRIILPVSLEPEVFRAPEIGRFPEKSLRNQEKSASEPPENRAVQIGNRDVHWSYGLGSTSRKEFSWSSPKRLNSSRSVRPSSATNRSYSLRVGDTAKMHLAGLSERL